jgi:thiol-disulfide isomerase/thioredoxin
LGGSLRPHAVKAKLIGINVKMRIIRGINLNFIDKCYIYKDRVSLEEVSIMSFWKKKDNLIITGFVAVFFIGLAFWYDLCCVRAAFLPGSGSSSPYEITFMDKDQTQFTLDQFKGKPAIIYFWATWCPSCVKKMATLNRFAKKFQDAGGQVLAISQDRSGISTIQAYYARNGYDNLDVYIESTGYLLHAFEAKGLPTAIFINAQGEEVGRIEGGVDWESSEMTSMVQDKFGIKL